MDIWRFVGTAAILTYSCSAIPNDIWFKRPSMTNIVVGIVYGPGVRTDLCVALAEVKVIETDGTNGPILRAASTFYELSIVVPRVDTFGRMFNHAEHDFAARLKEPKLFELFKLLERTRWQIGELKKKLATVRVDTDVL